MSFLHPNRSSRRIKLGINSKLCLKAYICASNLIRCQLYYVLNQRALQIVLEGISLQLNKMFYITFFISLFKYNIRNTSENKLRIPHNYILHLLFLVLKELFRCMYILIVTHFSRKCIYNIHIQSARSYEILLKSYYCT